MQVPTSPHPNMLARLADGAFIHRRGVVAAWLAILVLGIFAAISFGGGYTTNYSTPASDSAAAAHRLQQAFGGGSADQLDIVWKAANGAASPPVKARIDELLHQIRGVAGIVPATAAPTTQVSRDGKTGIARLALDRPATAVSSASGTEIDRLVHAASGDGLQVAANGGIPGLKAEPNMSAEVIGVAVAALVLLLVFGTVVAAGLPLLTALFGVAVAVMLGIVLAAVLDTPDWSLQMSLMIGIGVGIDYALLILTRYRSELHQGRSPREANKQAMSTAGRSVLTAGTTVVISLMGLLLMRLPYLNGVALAASLTVLIVMAASVTLLPAIVGFAGPRIDRLQFLHFGLPPADPDRMPAARWSRLVSRRPVIAIAGALALITVLASPLTGMRFGLPDAGNDPAGTTTRQAYDMVADGFGPGANGPLIAVAATGAAGDQAAVQRLVAAVKHDRQVTSVSPPQYSQAGDTALIAITPRQSPDSAATKKLVERLRDGPLAHAGMRVDLGGRTAAGVDQGIVTTQRLPLFIGAVLALSFLLLLTAFRAPIIALKAGLMNLLSIAAAFGVVSLVAEGGWAGKLVGIDSDVPVPPFIPVIMFSVLFGLSMDYEVFLISRIREERQRHGDSNQAVIAGVTRTAKVILAAAAIMVAVFGAFALSPDLILKLMGLGLATAILVDATLVRMLLVPAVMRLLGERAWWIPRLPRTPRLAAIATKVQSGDDSSEQHAALSRDGQTAGSPIRNQSRTTGSSLSEQTYEPGGLARSPRRRET